MRGLRLNRLTCRLHEGTSLGTRRSPEDLCTADSVRGTILTVNLLLPQKGRPHRREDRSWEAQEAAERVYGRGGS